MQILNTHTFNNQTKKRLPVTSDEAISVGSTLFYPMDGCKSKGHVAPVNAKTGRCQECVRIAKEKKRNTEELISKRVHREAIEWHQEKIHNDSWFGE